MRLQYTLFGPTGWLAQIGSIRFYLDDENSEVRLAQAALAEEVARSLPRLRDEAAAYLDLFVERSRVCGNADEEWWLDEIDFRDQAGDGTFSYALLFTLEGDDGGLWTVGMRMVADEHRPYRFERRQG